MSVVFDKVLLDGAALGHKARFLATISEAKLALRFTPAE
jgi:hypothetical protein